MTPRNSFPKALDDALRPFGFQKQGDDWIRVRGDMWECVNRQSSWLGGVTVNVLMKDPATEKLYLEIFGAEAVQMPPIQVRVGQLIDGYDRWWTKDEPDGPRQMADAVVKYGLPWFERVRTPEEQAENWFGRRTALTDRGYHGPSLVGLALTLYRMGEFERDYERPVYAAGSSLGAFLLLLGEGDRAFVEGRPPRWELRIDPDLEKCPRAPAIWSAG